jgi:hypothetical protein
MSQVTKKARPARIAASLPSTERFIDVTPKIVADSTGRWAQALASRDDTAVAASAYGKAVLWAQFRESSAKVPNMGDGQGYPIWKATIITGFSVGVVAATFNDTTIGAAAVAGLEG